VNAAVTRRLDVMLHVADKERLGRAQFVVLKNLVDLLPLVPDAGVGLVKILAKAAGALLHVEMVLVHRAQQKCAHLAGAAEFQKLPRVRQRADGVLHLPEAAMKPCFELRQRDVRRVLVVKRGERQLKLRAELLQRHLGAIGLCQDIIGRLPDGGQVVHQRARPVEDDVADHGRSVNGLGGQAILCSDSVAVAS